MGNSGFAHSVQVNGIELHYKDYGQGTPLVLLHGFFTSGEFWNAYVDEFAKKYRVIVPDLRGHGFSTNPKKEFTHRQSAQDIYALLDHLEIERFCAIGFSTGGMTLIHMATQQPERVEAAILISATSYFPISAREFQRNFTKEFAGANFFGLMQKLHKHGAEQIMSLFSMFQEFAAQYDDMNFTPDHLSTISARTLIIHGDRDGLFPISIAVEMYQAISESYLYSIPNGSHSLFFDTLGGTAPGGDSFVKLVCEFLQGNWGMN